MTSISDLVHSSSLVFAGVVTGVGASNVATLAASGNLVTVRVTRGLRFDPALGDITGRVVTVHSDTAQDLRIGDRAVFFARSWIHADTIAVHEIERKPAEAEEAAAAAVLALPDDHLAERLADAELVVLAQVTAIQPVTGQKLGRHSPNWAKAVLQVKTALKGAAEAVTVVFPTSVEVEWYKCPHLTKGQRGIFLVHRDEPRALREPHGIPADEPALTLLDPADVQNESEQGRVEALLQKAQSRGASS